MEKNILVKKLESERDMLLEELKDIGRLNTDTGEWEAVPEQIDVKEADQNDMADRFEDFELRSSTMEALEPRLQAILKALKNINSASFGKCEVCQIDIEDDRLEVNPAAQTCKEHME